MNERIRELAEQARDWGYAEHSGYTAQLLFEQKFAELIVAECVAQCWTVSEMEHKGNVLSECSKRMRKYFGVEE